MNPHEQAAYVARWEAAGLDPECCVAACAMAVLEYVGPAGAWAWTIARMQVYYGTRQQVAEVRILVAVATAVGEG